MKRPRKPKRGRDVLPRTTSATTVRDRLARLHALLYPARVRAITKLIAEALAALSRFVDRIRRGVLMVAFLALLAVGLHVGSDRIDDHLFVVINALDSFA